MTPLRILLVGMTINAFFSAQALAYTYQSRQLNVRTTAYTHSESDHIEWGKKTAIGTELKFTHEYTSAASDWSWLPLGTEFRIKGVNRHFVIDDYGSALTGKKTVDFYFPSKAMMNRWGLRFVDIIITKYGDYDESLRVLENHAQYTEKWHVHKMLADIKANRSNSEGKNPNYESVPSIPTELDETLMAGASIPKWEWKKDAPSVQPDPKQPQESPQEQQPEMVVADVDETTSQPAIPPLQEIIEVVEPPVPDASEWQGEPFVLAYAEPESGVTILGDGSQVFTPKKQREFDSSKKATKPAQSTYYYPERQATKAPHITRSYAPKKREFRPISQVFR